MDGPSGTRHGGDLGVWEDVAISLGPYQFLLFYYDKSFATVGKKSTLLDYLAWTTMVEILLP